MSKVEHEENGSQATGMLGDHLANGNNQANGNNGSTNPRRRIEGRGVQALGAKAVPGVKRTFQMGLAPATKLVCSIQDPFMKESQTTSGDGQRRKRKSI